MLSLKCLCPLIRHSLGMVDLLLVASYSRSFYVLMVAAQWKFSHQKTAHCWHSVNIFYAFKVLQHLTHFWWSQSDNKQLCLHASKTLEDTNRDQWQFTEQSCEILQRYVQFLLGLLLVPGLPSWLQIRSATHSTLWQSMGICYWPYISPHSSC